MKLLGNLALLVGLVALLVGGVRAVGHWSDALRAIQPPTPVYTARKTPESGVEPAPSLPPREHALATTHFYHHGNHPMTEVAPLTADDVLRQIRMGFTEAEILDQLRKRGFAGFRSQSEREQYRAQIPASLFTQMERPEVLLSKEGQLEYAERLSGQSFDVVAWVRAQDQMIQAQIREQGVSQRHLPWVLKNFLTKRDALCERIEGKRRERRDLLAKGKDSTGVSKEIKELEKELQELQPPKIK